MSVIVERKMQKQEVSMAKNPHKLPTFIDRSVPWHGQSQLIDRKVSEQNLFNSIHGPVPLTMFHLLHGAPDT